MQLVEHIASKSQLLKVDYFYFYCFFGSNIANFEGEDILAICIDFTIGCFLSFLYSLIVFYSSLLLFLNNAFHSLATEGGNKAVDACVGIDGEVVFQLEISAGRIVVGL